MNLRSFILIIFIVCTSVAALGQDKAVVFGTVRLSNNKPVELAEVFLAGYPGGTTTDINGKYEFNVPANEQITIYFNYLGYKRVEKKIRLKAGERKLINMTLKMEGQELKGVNVRAERERSMSITRLDPKVIDLLPDLSGNFEAVLKTFPGVSSNNEMSSQYSVRGGNFDENLVYVNDIEVYRPFLVRSGQQEGLSFINPDLVSSILFSAGGFEAKYGDKLSSVLDIRYKKPTEFAASMSASLLGGTAHLQGSTDDHRFTYISGLRYKSTRYILGSLDTKGNYKPTFIDFQTYLTFDVTDKFEIDFLGNFAQNKYLFAPETGETSFGTVHEALKLKIYYDGKEFNQFTTYTGAVAGHYHVNDNFKLSLIASAFRTQEEETFDVMGQYFLNELDNQLGSDNLGDSLMNLGIGTFLNHARNYLDVSVVSISHKAQLSKDEHFIQWGAKAQHEIISNKLNEWEMIDSAGYSLPYSDNEVHLFSSIRSETDLEANRVTSFIQDTYMFSVDSAECSITAGVRANYLDLNNELLISPRFNASIKPKWKRDYLFRFAAGYYYQPPFVKEMKDLEGKINTDIKAQKSIHLVAGSDLNFTAWQRPFKFITEVYYKKLDNLIPYDVDNVRIRYYGNNNSEGYATGIDFKVNGQFVNGVESWASLSFMRTREVIDGTFVRYNTDSTIQIVGNSGYIPRPTDQIMNFGLFFQDYLPGFPSYKMQLSLLYGTGLPFGPPNSYKAVADLRMPPYRRVDIGFSKVIKSEDKESKIGMLKNFKSLWISVEIFNLLQIKNTISHIWITDIRNHQYAVPNYLTSRRINVKLIAKF